ncbi:POU domain, class 4, transcription factor 1-like isoform X2 [Eriocheir sinensis]|uniref:POU domain, class 4, transcription factor 1-like isoform X2 n=1 Tax=Eriocheir sinensis TaxID=95602 RepID=UPI0021C96054|nr:POU domain, class 4, transcription factor 1-like isoform X2 [Eriocheir sinensis]
MPVQTDGPEDHKAKYKTLKRKLKLLIYENECFQEELRKAQRALLRVRRDKSFLLDRLLQYQRGPDSSTDSEQTEESDAEVDAKGDHKRKRLAMEGTAPGSSSSQTPPSKPPSKKKKSSSSGGGSGGGGGGGGGSGGGSSSSSKASKQSGKQIPGMVGVSSSSNNSGGGGGGGVVGAIVQAGVGMANPVASATPTMRKLAASHLTAGSLHAQAGGGNQAAAAAAAAAIAAAGGVAGTRRSLVAGGGVVGVGGVVGGHQSDGQLSREEVERRLAARQPLSDFTTTTVSLTLPNQLFSDNIMEGDFMEEEVETSPSNIEDDVTVDNYD